MNIRNLRALAVHLQRRRVGTITRLPGDKQFFAFDQAYADDPERPVLSLSFKGSGGNLVSAVSPVHRRVPSFFSNLLPEGHLRTYLAEQAGVNPEREFFLLAALGADLAGAVTIVPFDEAGEIELDENSHEFSPGEPDNVLRFSLAGVQLKFSAVLESAGGLTIPAHGIGGDWIVKLPASNFAAVAENEFVMLELARAIGISVPRIRLVAVKEIAGLPVQAAGLQGKALAVERFDRAPGGGRIHMEDFAQVFGVYPENKYKTASYANIARVLWAETGEQGAFEFVKRLVFSVLTGNGDMHLKNWSLLYPDTRTPVLSPAYDLVSTLPYIANDRLALTFGGSRSMDAITPDQVRRLTEKAGMPLAPVMQLVRQTAEATIASWKTLDQRDLLPAAIRKAVDTQIEAASQHTTKMLVTPSAPSNTRN